MTPIWDATYLLQALLNPNSDPYGLMWSNLVRVDYEKPNGVRGRVPQSVEETICGIPLLTCEIQITQPDVVVFFTGPEYDERLTATFEGVEAKPIPGFDSHLLANLEHRNLPANTFRTYHPGYLVRRKGQIGLVVSTIAELIAGRQDMLNRSYR